MNGKKVRCKGCDEWITWCITNNGKSTPLNLDGDTHWATCSEAKKFRRERA